MFFWMYINIFDKGIMLLVSLPKITCSLHAILLLFSENIFHECQSQKWKLCIFFISQDKIKVSFMKTTTKNYIYIYILFITWVYLYLEWSLSISLCDVIDRDDFRQYFMTPSRLVLNKFPNGCFVVTAWWNTEFCFGFHIPSRIFHSVWAELIK